MKHDGDRSIRSMTGDDLKLVLAWRNHPKIRENMFSQHEISWDEHRRWFERACADPLRRLLLVEDAGIPIGFVQLSGVRSGGSAEWGFYVAPDAGSGAGRKLGSAALQLAFGDLKLHKMCGQALDFNHASIRFHEAAGFKREGVLREQHQRGDSYHDIVLFGMLRSEWSPGRLETP